jgi:hypothetical protein
VQSKNIDAIFNNMKRAYLVLALAIIGLSACQNQSDSVKAFIPGTYINSAKGEYAQAEDTLTITLAGNNAYFITRNTTYQAIRDGKFLPKHHKIRKLNGVFDPQTQLLNETINGEVFRFDPAKRVLIVNSKGEYKKIN